MFGNKDNSVNVFLQSISNIEFSKMLAATLGLLQLAFGSQCVKALYEQRAIEVVSHLLLDANCPGVLVTTDKTSEVQEEEKLVNSFIEHHHRPVTILEILEDSVIAKLESSSNTPWKFGAICQNVVMFARELSSSAISKMYSRIKRLLFVDKVFIVVRHSSVEEGRRVLYEFQNEKLSVVIGTLGHDLQLLTWSASNVTHLQIINKKANNANNNNHNVTSRHRPVNLSGRHLVIGTLQYPPAVIIDNRTLPSIIGIEPSIIEVLSKHLQFTYEYVLALPHEMWGEILGHEGNYTLTGLLGMLSRKEIDVAIGQLYISTTRWAFIDYTNGCKFTYESYLVPAPQPYAKWTAVIYAFNGQTWLATLVTALFIIIMLRVIAVWSPSLENSAKYGAFKDFNFCCLYVVGNLATVQMQPQTIMSNAHRMFLIWWLFGTLILTTGYRSGLISFMTFPFTPPAIDTVQQLVDSPLKIAVYNTFFKDTLLNSPTSDLEKKLGEHLIPSHSMTEMFRLLGTNKWSAQSNLDNLRYMAATWYPSTAAGPRVHLIREAILPVQAAFGLQKQSQLEAYLNKDIQQLIEAGLIDFHSEEFAKKLDKWNPKKGNDRISFSMNSLQGAFYLLGFGKLISTVAFVAELIVFNYNKAIRRRTQGRSRLNSTQSVANNVKCT